MRFDSYHPFVNLIFFVSVITFTICFNHPVFVAISFVSSFVYSVKLNKYRALIFNLFLIVISALFVWYYSSYNHFGVTVLKHNFIDNNITLESIVYGIIISLITSSVIMWFSCVHYIFTTDKLVYLFGKITPKLSLYFSILLRTIPRLKQKYKQVSLAQRCLGRGTNQKNIFKSVHNFFRIAWIVLLWTLESFVDISNSMKSRGYTLKGRTAFSIYRFDNRDRSFVITIFLNLTIVILGVLFNQTSIIYNPEIVLNNITTMSFLFYFSYAFICLLPTNLQIKSELHALSELT